MKPLVKTPTHNPITITAIGGVVSNKGNYVHEICSFRHIKIVCSCNNIIVTAVPNKYMVICCMSFGLKFTLGPNE